MSEWNEKPQPAAPKLGLDPKGWRHVPPCPSNVQEKENQHLWNPVQVIPCRLTHLILITVSSLEDTEAEKLYNLLRVT